MPIYESQFTGDDIDLAVERVLQDTFPSVQSSFLDEVVVFGPGESKYLTKEFQMDPDTVYHIRISAVFAKNTNTVSDMVDLYSQVTGGFSGQLVSHGVSVFADTPHSAYTTTFSASGGTGGDLSLLALGNPNDLNTNRAVTFDGFIKTDSVSSSFRFYYDASEFTPLTVASFSLVLTKMKPQDIVSAETV